MATKSDELLEKIEKGLLYMLTHNKNIFDDGTGHGYRDGDVIYYE